MSNAAYVLDFVLEQRVLLSDGVATPLIGSCLQDVNPGDWFFYMKASGNLTSSTATPAFLNLGREVSGEAGAQVGAGASQVSNGLGGFASLAYQEEDMIFASLITFDYRPENEDDCDVSSLKLPVLECGDNVTVTVDEERINGSCPYDYVLNLTYHYMDKNWNMVSKSRTVTIFDDNFPVLDEVDDKILACNTTFEDLPTPGATDKCDPNVTVTLTNRTVTPGKCPQEYRVDYVWTAVDDCENEDSTEAYIQVIDEYSPWFINFPAGYSQECSDPAPEAIEVDAADNCDDDVDVEVTNSTTPGSCPQEYSITFTYFAEDDCGHNRTNSYTVVVEDNTDPILTLGPNLDFSCEETVTKPTASCSDNCDTQIAPTDSDSFSGDQCEGVTTYVFTCTDDCGNDVSDSRTVTVHDRKNPIWDTPLPTDETVYCADYEEQGDMTATDNCGEVTVTKNFTVEPGNCESRYVEVRNWYACDECNNCITHTVRYTVIDNTGPVIDEVEPVVNYECHEIEAPPSVCASDDCTN
ncbi:MAG: hypothetical protein KIT69_08810, partial [Propionibacteriaceae bacterium]|nr:hypothetical protein [Propionibacteriaceae bacterium]